MNRSHAHTALGAGSGDTTFFPVDDPDSFFHDIEQFSHKYLVIPPQKSVMETKVAIKVESCSQNCIYDLLS